MISREISEFAKSNHAGASNAIVFAMKIGKSCDRKMLQIGNSDPKSGTGSGT